MLRRRSYLRLPSAGQAMVMLASPLFAQAAPTYGPCPGLTLSKLNEAYEQAVSPSRFEAAKSMVEPQVRNFVEWLIRGDGQKASTVERERQFKAALDPAFARAKAPFDEFRSVACYDSRVGWKAPTEDFKDPSVGLDGIWTGLLATVTAPTLAYFGLTAALAPIALTGINGWLVSKGFMTAPAGPPGHVIGGVMILVGTLGAGWTYHEYQAALEKARNEHGPLLTSAYSKATMEALLRFRKGLLDAATTARDERRRQLGAPSTPAGS